MAFLGITASALDELDDHLDHDGLLALEGAGLGASGNHRNDETFAVTRRPMPLVVLGQGPLISELCRTTELLLLLLVVQYHRHHSNRI